MDTNLIVGLVSSVLGIVGIVVVVPWFFRSRQRKLETIFRKQAAKRNGQVTVEKAPLWDIRPILTLYRENREISVHEYGTDQIGYDDSTISMEARLKTPENVSIAVAYWSVFRYLDRPMDTLI